MTDIFIELVLDAGDKAGFKSIRELPKLDDHDWRGPFEWQPELLSIQSFCPYEVSFNKLNRPCLKQYSSNDIRVIDLEYNGDYYELYCVQACNACWEEAYNAYINREWIPCPRKKKQALLNENS